MVRMAVCIVTRTSNANGVPVLVDGRAIADADICIVDVFTGGL